MASRADRFICRVEGFKVWVLSMLVREAKAVFHDDIASKGRIGVRNVNGTPIIGKLGDAAAQQFDMIADDGLEVQDGAPRKPGRTQLVAGT